MAFQADAFQDVQLAFQIISTEAAYVSDFLIATHAPNFFEATSSPTYFIATHEDIHLEPQS